MLNAYDEAGRQKIVWAKDHPSEPFNVRSFIVYGDDPNNAPANPENQNLLGYIFKSYDESGLTTISNYDFKANQLTKVQKVIRDSLLLDAINDGTNNNWEVAPYRTEWTTEPWNEESNLLEGNYQTDMVYDAINRVAEVEYPSDINSVRKKLIPTYNRAGALEKVSFNNEDYVNHIAYNAKGQRLLISFGNDIMTRYTYDEHTFLLKRVRTESYLQNDWEFSSDGSVKEDKAYTYDFAGNILAINEIGSDIGLPADPDELFREFSYDALYRLIEASGREYNTSTNAPWEDITADPSPNINNVTGYTRKFHYDRMGNMLKMEHIGDSSFTRIFNPDSEGDPPTEFGADNLLTTFKVGTSSYSYQYDDNGNMIKENSNRFFEWDHADRLRVFYNQAASGSEPSVYEQYLYNSAGERVKKITRKQSGIYEVSVYVDGIFEYQKKVNGTTEERNFEHILDDSKRIAELRTGAFSGDDNKPVKYLIEDHLQSVGLRLDENGTTLDREEYFPFGESSFRTTSKKRYRYCGKEKDSQSGLYYYGARYYAPWLCRFISCDPMKEERAWLTPYNYVQSNPINLTDPTGALDDGGGGGDPVKKGDTFVGDDGKTHTASIDEVVITGTNISTATDDQKTKTEATENLAPTSFTYTLDYKANSSNIPFVESYRHAAGTFTNVLETGKVSDFIEGDTDGGFNITLKVPKIYPHNRDNPTYTTYTGTGSDLDSLSWEKEESLGQAFIDGFNVGWKVGLSTAIQEQLATAILFKRFNLSKPKSFEGADPELLRVFFQKKGWKIKPIENKGFKAINPNKSEDVIQIIRGNASKVKPGSNIHKLKQGDYLHRKSVWGKHFRVPLKGSPAKNAGNVN